MKMKLHNFRCCGMNQKRLVDVCIKCVEKKRAPPIEAELYEHDVAQILCNELLLIAANAKLFDLENSDHELLEKTLSDILYNLRWGSFKQASWLEFELLESYIGYISIRKEED